MALKLLCICENEMCDVHLLWNVHEIALSNNQLLWNNTFGHINTGRWWTFLWSKWVIFSQKRGEWKNKTHTIVLVWASWPWVRTPKSVWWQRDSSTPRYPDTEVQFTFAFSKTASHFQHDGSAVIHATNGLSSHGLINKHRDPGEPLWSLITLWPRQNTVLDLHNKTRPTSIQCISCVSNNCQRKQNPSFLISYFRKLLLTSEGNLVTTQLERMLRLRDKAKNHSSSTISLIMSLLLWQDQAGSVAAANFGERHWQSQASGAGHGARTAAWSGGAITHVSHQKELQGHRARKRPAEHHFTRMWDPKVA